MDLKILPKEDIFRLAAKRINEINDLIKQLPQYEKLTAFESFNSLCAENGQPEVTKDDYDKTELSQINPKKIGELFIAVKNVITNHLTPKAKINAHWAEYNPNYKKQISSLLIDFNHIIPKDFLIHNILSEPKKFTYLYEAHIHLPPNFLFNRFIILEHFAYTDKNYIIFGKNGAGKTQLLKQLPSVFGFENSYVVPASRDISWGIKKPRLDFKMKEKELGSTFMLDEMGWSATRFLTMLLTIKSSEEVKDEKVTYSKDMLRITSVTLAKVVEIFNTLSPSRKIRYTFEQKEERWFLCGDDKEYSISEASDGEKSLLQYIIYILLLPQNSFVFIDEPENHLNAALLSELFDILEHERNDIIFIYCTHCVDFIESRNNVKMLYLKNYTGKSWDIEPIRDSDDMPISATLDIIGTKKEILFVEGNKSSYDYKLYSRLFPQFKTIPMGSCEKVKEICRSVNGHNEMFLRKAYGIIDYDFKSPQEIERLKDKGVYVLKFSEIENLLICEDFIEIMCGFKNDGDLSSIIKFKEHILETVKDEKNKIIDDFINKTYPKIMEYPKVEFTSGNKLKKDIKISNKKNTKKLLNKTKKFRNDLEEIIKNKDYSAAIRNLPYKKFIDGVTIFGFKNAKEYVNDLTKYLEQHKDFADNIATKYFPDFE